jgi:hypothetical protein
MTRSELRSQRVAELSEHFDRYVAVFDRAPPFQRRDQLESHEHTIGLLRSSATVSAAIGSDAFVKSLWATLRAWGIGIRGSSLLDLPAFQSTLQHNAPAIQALEGMRIESSEPAHADLVWHLITRLGITHSKAKLVATTKTLHHLLPDLIPPVDRAYTGRFFAWQPAEFQNAQEQIFRTVWAGFVEIARCTSPGRFVDDTPWHTSSTKVIDNAIVGYCIEHNLIDTRPARPAPARQVAGARGPWTSSELRTQLLMFEDELRRAGLKENSVRTYVGRSEAFIRWLEGNYVPRGPNQSSPL